jgi:hypothetical protein
VLLRKGATERLLQPGEIVPADAVSRQWLEDGIRERHVVAEDSKLGDGVPPPVTNPTIDPVGDLAAKTGGMTQKEITGIVAGQPKRASPWQIDPKKLDGKTIAELNSLVRERDPHMAPFLDSREAAAQLSLDFGK